MSAPFTTQATTPGLVTEEFIPLSKPCITEDDVMLVNKVLRSGNLVQGRYVQLLEETFSNYHDVKHAIAVSNGTATLHLALQVLGISPGDEVIVPAFTYIATANVVELVGATPVFADVDERTFNINPALIEQKITSRTKAIIPVHQFGLASDIEQVCAIAARHNLFVIEDAACALGAEQNGKKVGSFGIMSSFSLHPRKSITAGEGGVLLTNDDELAKKLRQLRNHGIQYENGAMDFVEAGYNYRLTDMQAALAWSQFQRLDAIIYHKQQIAEVYRSAITNADLLLPVTPSNHNHTWQSFHILLGNHNQQQQTIAWLRSKNIGCNYGAQCIPAQTFYKNKYGFDAEEMFPLAYKAFTKGLALPMYEELSVDNAMYISHQLNLLS